ncbi:antigen WC1.1-like isoform X2 [Polypterus senegalus]|nr:antigen WC1.1-like isoform X2 [Polypterus senegalus]
MARLVKGRGPCEGRVEVFHSGAWGTVCDDNWDMQDAAVVCRELGCGKALSALSFAHFGQGTGRIWHYHCHGLESTFSECRSAQTTGCEHYEDASVVCSGTGARLVGGSSSCSGRLEVLRDNSWKSICDVNFNQTAAEVVCQELECGALKEYRAGMFGQGKGSFWEKKIQCRGNERKIFDCPFSESATLCTERNDVGLVCVPYRLVNGSNSCSGRVELYYGMQWGTVCDRYWDLQDASVVCNHLGCGYAIEVPGQASFGKGSGEIWRDNLQCKGDEADLTKCPALDYGSEECTHRHDAGVICSGINMGLPSRSRKPTEGNQFALRLTNGTGVCDGRLEIFYNGSWGTVCDDSWDLLDANVVCRQLQCETPVNAITPVSYGPGSGHIWLDDLHCQGNESSLWDCRHQTWGQHNCRHKEDVGVNCTEFKMLRLTDGCSGQLQAFYNNSWGSVCANNMDKATAAMICQELGCGNLTSDVKEELSKLDPDPKWLDKVRCRGHEASIWQCPSSPWGKNACTRTEVAKLSCTEPLELRLVGGTNNCSGRVEIMYGDTWGTVCDDDWDLKDVKVVCRQLRCGEAVSAELEFGGGSGVIWLNKVKCRGTEAHLWDCQHEPLGKNDCVHKEDAGVKCTGFAQDIKAPKEVPNIKALKEQPILVIVCIVLGALLFLILVLLVGQLQRNRTLKKGMAMDELLPNNNAVYEEIEYKLARQGTYGAPRKGSFLSDELPYDYEDIEDDDQDHTLGRKLASLETDSPGYYDDTAIEQIENLPENISHDELLYSYDDVEEPLENSTVDSHAAVQYPLPPEYDDIEDEAVGEQSP